MIRPFARVHPSISAVTASLATSLIATSAFAAGSNMPWEQPLQQILQSIEGPVSKIVAVIIIIVTGLTLAFGDTAGGFRRLIQIVSIAFAASSFFLSCSRPRLLSQAAICKADLAVPSIEQYPISALSASAERAVAAFVSG